MKIIDNKHCTFELVGLSLSRTQQEEVFEVKQFTTDHFLYTVIDLEDHGVTISRTFKFLWFTFKLTNKSA